MLAMRAHLRPAPLVDSAIDLGRHTLLLVFVGLRLTLFQLTTSTIPFLLVIFIRRCSGLMPRGVVLGFRSHDV